MERDSQQRIDGGAEPAVIAHLTYHSYAWNRAQYPAVAPERWKLVYGSAVDQMESRYQEDRQTLHRLAGLGS